MRVKATTDPEYLMLDMWFEGPHQQAIATREAAKLRLTKGLHMPAPSSCGRPQSSTATSSTDQSPHSRSGSPRYVVAGKTSG
jgi:hypothetical protein